MIKVISDSTAALPTTEERVPDDPVFDAPGNGTWELETTHFQRPITRFAAAAFMAGFHCGFAEGTARYGLLFDHIKAAMVNGFVYNQPAMFGADGPNGAATEAEMQARIATSARAFTERLWRKDLDEWDRVDKPAAIAKHHAIQDVNPTALSDEELAGHLGRCHDHLEAMMFLHHKYTATTIVSVGDFLAGAQEWTGATVGELLELLRGTSPISTGFAATELDALARSIGASESAQQVLRAAAPPAATLDALAADPDAGADTRAYLDAVRFRSIGYDVGDLTAGEMPELLVEAIRAAVAGAAAAPQDDATLAEIKLRVPAEHTAEFEERLGEARLINRLRDERGVYADGWGTGLARRALLEAGRRLHRAGKLADPAHAVDMEAAELAALLRGEPGPSAEEVAQRYRWRTSRTIEDAPPLLGPNPAPPPPLESLPPAARRGARAVGAVMVNLFQLPDMENTDTVLHGLAVNAGTYEGRARVVDVDTDFARIKYGDVMVTRMTSPYFNVVLPLLGAIVTDRGGQLCHAAIVAREYGIPGIVGTREATRMIPDGAWVRVDGEAGEVTLLR
ncbi:MAG: PEP-utilizing enzyme [Pseudonocardiaceae bacterium]